MGDKRVRQALGLAIDRQAAGRHALGRLRRCAGGHNYPEYGAMFFEGAAFATIPTRPSALLKAAGYRGEEIVYRTMPNYYTNALARRRCWSRCGRRSASTPAAGGRELHPDARRGRADRQQLQLHAAARSARRALDFLGAGSRSSRSGRGPQHPELSTRPAVRWRPRPILPSARAVQDACWMPGRTRRRAPSDYQPPEFYALKRSMAWRPYTFYFMDLRSDNLAFD